MYCERESRVLEDPAGIQTEALTLNPELQKHAHNNPHVYRRKIALSAGLPPFYPQDNVNPSPTRTPNPQPCLWIASIVVFSEAGAKPKTGFY
jgi:hypothetical protein